MARHVCEARDIFLGKERSMRLDLLELSDNTVQLALDGRLDLEGTQSVEQKFSFAATTKSLGVIVDLSAVTFLASIGIRMLLTAARAQATRGGKLVLAAPQDPVRKVLEAAGIDQLVPILNDVDAARSSVGG
jgi:anti-sigma B factor antagonist